MAREFRATSFYDHTSYPNIYYAAQIPLEYFLADVLMRHDLTRIVYSSNEYAFRRRFELSAGTGGELTPASLNLPFVNYWYNDFWQPDDRLYVTHTYSAMHGIWLEGYEGYLKILPVKATMVGAVYYSRDDDARFGFEALMREFRPKGPIQLATTVTWRNKEISIPVYVTLEQPKFNVKYKETDWLKAQRILPIEFSFTVRTYIIQPSKQLMINDEPSSDSTPPFNSLSSNLLDNDDISISEQIILEFAAAKQWGDLTSGAGLGEATTDIITGYLDPPLDIMFAVEVLPPTLPTVIDLSWTLDLEQLDQFKFIEILVPGQPSIIIEDPNVTTYSITGLSPSSLYDITILYHTVSGDIKDIHISATTTDDPTNPVGSPLTRKKGRLKGMEW